MSPNGVGHHPWCHAPASSHAICRRNLAEVAADGVQTVSVALIATKGTRASVVLTVSGHGASSAVTMPWAAGQELGGALQEAAMLARP